MSVASAALDMPRRGAGRPPGSYDKFVPENTNVLINALANGYPINLSCRMAGVGASTVNDWVNRGDTGDPDFADFSRAYHAARTEGIKKHHNRVDTASETDWRASAWLLPRIAAEDYADQSKHQVSVSVSGTIQHEHTLQSPDLSSFFGLLQEAGGLVIDGSAEVVKPELEAG